MSKAEPIIQKYMTTTPHSIDAAKTVKELWSESSDHERRQRFKFQELETTLEFCEATEVRS